MDAAVRLFGDRPYDLAAERALCTGGGDQRMRTDRPETGQKAGAI